MLGSTGTCDGLGEQDRLRERLNFVRVLGFVPVA
jgi:hypothetical protein